ncbi:hypothetical protein F8388_011911 [Cannabis sativa]|uniref:Uncharacterized protein n=1 Tax=Cannabis sativa TaxID=3483 RepID=A0A7J6GFU1_CANSA|nr:hypothetical protein F8388_011911 [Cannabis sativa]
MVKTKEAVVEMGSRELFTKCPCMNQKTKPCEAPNAYTNHHLKTISWGQKMLASIYTHHQTFKLETRDHKSCHFALPNINCQIPFWNIFCTRKRPLNKLLGLNYTGKTKTHDCLLKKEEKAVHQVSMYESEDKAM